MLPPGSSCKYHDHAGSITDAEIAAHLAGRATYAVPLARNGRASVIAYDVDSDHLADPEAPIHALLGELDQRGLWAFAQYDPARRRGYVWAPFDDLADVAQLAALGDAILAAVVQPEWAVEHRTSTANAGSDTRLPMGRHTWTGRRGQLLLAGQRRDLDTDFAGALAALQQAYRPNPVQQLPPAPAPTYAATSVHAPTAPSPAATGRGIDIAGYNRATDLLDLLISCGATPVSRRLLLCPFHDDHHASLALYRTPAGAVLCHCKSAHSACPLAERPTDAFGVYCLHHNLTPAQALRRLNGHPDDPPTPPRTRSHGPGGAPPPPGGATPPPQACSAPQRPAQRVSAAPAPALPAPPTPPRTAAHDGSRRPARRCRTRDELLALLAQHPAGYCRGHRQLAHALRVDERTIERNLRRLEADGLITCTHRGHDGQANVYHLAAGGGRHLPPTCKHDHDLILESDSAGRGGQPAAVPAPPGATQLADATPAAWYDDQVVAQEPTAGPGRREWHADLAPKELHALLYGHRELVARWQAAYVPAGDDQAEAGALAQQAAFPATDAGDGQAETLASGAPVELDDQAETLASGAPVELDDDQAVALASAAPAAPPQRTPRRRRTYTAGELARRIIAAERKAARLERGRAQEQRQARAIRHQVVQLKAALAQLQRAAGDGQADAGDDQADAGLGTPPAVEQLAAALQPVVTAPRPVGRAPRRGEHVPPLPAQLGPELEGDWVLEWAAGGWRAVHPAGWATASYGSPEVVRRMIVRREYRRVGG